MSVYKPLVSVVVPSYNYADYLDERIEGILNQTYSNIELIIIDDCSPDHSVEVLQKYAKHPKIRLVLRDKNEGWISANNEGAKMATGEFILFAQCDDTCDLTLIERLVDSLQHNPSAGISFCKSVLVDKRGNVLSEDYDDRESSFQSACREDVLLSKQQMSLFLFNACVIPNLSAVLIRKACFDTVGYFSSDYQVCSDWDWYFRICQEYDVAYVSQALNRFMQHDTTIRSSTKDKVLFEEYFRLLLSNLTKVNLTFLQRWLIRYRVMELWSVHIISSTLAGVANFPYHFSRVIKLDALSFLALPVALMFRIASLVKKVLFRMLGK